MRKKNIMKRKLIYGAGFVVVIVCTILWVRSTIANSGVSTTENDYFDVYTDFPHNMSLVGEGIIVEDGLLRYPFRIRQLGGYIYVLDLHGEDNFCHIFDEKDYSHITSFTNRGNGPEDVLQAMDMYVVNKDSIWLFDTDKREVTLWGYNEHERVVVRKEAYRMKEDMILSANCTWYSDSVFYFTDKSGNNRVLKCNKDGIVTERIGSIPSIKPNKRIGNGILAQAWNGYIKCNPLNQIMVVASQLGDVIEIYNLKEGTRHVLYGPHGEPVYEISPNGFAIPSGIMGYSDLEITDRYIYAVFHGRSFKDIIKDPQGTPDGGEYIHVYDFNGNPICRLILDHSIYGIDVDEENGIIWATDVNSEEQIIRYNIPSVIG